MLPVITYLFRSPGTGHSIEELFSSIQLEIDQQLGIQTTAVRLPTISRDWWSIWQNLCSLRGLTSRVFHITGDIHYAALALPASRTILTIHDCSLLKKNRNRPIRYTLFWLLWYYLPIRRVRLVTVVSEKSRQELIQYVGKAAKKAVVVPNGYDPAFRYKPADFRKERPLLLQLGTAPNKNLSHLIAAIEGIVCTLILVGPLTNDIREDLQKRQIDYRHYVNLSREGILNLYANSDIVTFLSTYEGFGMPVLEANAIGRVVITSDIAPMNQLASQAAHFVDPTDVTAIRQGILKLIQDNTYRQALIEAGRANAQRYTIAMTASQYAALYQKIIVPESFPSFAL